MAHPVVHFEILGSDGPTLQSFYQDLFGWKVNADNPMKYGMVEKDEQGIGGGIAASQDGSSMVTVYVQADDPQAVLDRAEQLGGTTVMPVMEIPNAATIAQFADPAGNIVGVVKS